MSWIKQVKPSDNENSQCEDDQNNIQELELNKIQNWRKSYKANYDWPMPPDILFEEKAQFKQAQYSKNSIYEWNIDEMTEHTISLTSYRK